MSDTHGKRKALGRGLSALLESSEGETPQKEIGGEFMTGYVTQIPVGQIEPNPFQPRTRFHETELAELAASIREHGIIQPLSVRKIGHDRYQIISGERRYKAAVICGIPDVPAYIRLANDEQMLEMALVENIQREDLNPLEIAISFQRLLEECKIRQEALSQKVGKDRSTISNYIRLLKLPGEIQVAVRDNLITMGHARAILGVDGEKTQLILLKKILERKLSVRQVEDLVRNAGQVKTPGHPALPDLLPARYEQARSGLRIRLESEVGMKVNRKGAGTIVIPFRSAADLDRIMAKLDT